MNRFEKAFYNIFPERLLEDKLLKEKTHHHKKLGKKHKRLSNGERMYQTYRKLSGQPFGEPVYVSDGMSIFPDGHMEDGW